MLLAVPAMTSIACSTSRAFRSCIFVSAIDCSCARLRRPTLFRFGSDEPLSSRSASLIRTAAGGERARATIEYSLGESVKVTSGPLSDFDGEIVDVNPDQQKLKVLVDIFERQVPVELGFDQVKKLD